MRRKSILFSAIFAISLFISTASVGRISAAGESAPINTDAEERLSDGASFLDTETSLSAGSATVDHSGSESQSALRNTTLQYKARNEKSISSSQILYDKKDEQRQEEEKAEEYRAEAERLMLELQMMSKEIAKVTENLEETNKEVSALNEEITETEKEIKELEKTIREDRAEMGEIIRMMYEEGYEDPMLFITCEDEYDVINRNEYVKDVNRYLNDYITNLNDMLQEQVTKNTRLVDLKDEQEIKQELYEEAQADLTKNMAELEQLIEDAERKADSAEALAEALKREIEEEERRREEEEKAKNIRANNAVIRDSSGTDFFYAPAYNYTADELKLLAGIIEAEAGSEDYAGMIAVGSVVMNRVDDSRFPNTIAGVIYAPYQFEPADTGSLALILAKGPKKACYIAAEDVLNGTRNVDNLYFKAKWYAEEHGISGVNIGGNVFH